MSGDALWRSCVPLGMKDMGNRDDWRRFVEILCATRDERDR